jgi:hypothetical protein
MVSEGERGESFYIARSGRRLDLLISGGITFMP